MKDDHVINWIVDAVGRTGAKDIEMGFNVYLRIVDFMAQTQPIQSTRDLTQMEIAGAVVTVIHKMNPNQCRINDIVQRSVWVR